MRRNCIRHVLSNATFILYTVCSEAAGAGMEAK
jgi:hypothetical protein